LTIRVTIPILGALGMGISGYLAILYLQDREPVCFGSSDCGYIFSSSYSRIWGVVPLPLAGWAMYAVLTGLGLLAQWDKKKPSPRAALGMYTVALAGTLYSACLTYLQVSVIHAFCPWCLASAVIVTCIFLISLKGLFTSNA
jgi:uncharacterized membrane protein